MLLVEEILALVIGLIMITQVIVPVLANRPVFWLLRRSSRAQSKLLKAKQAETEAKQLLEAAQHEARAYELKQQAEAAEQRALDKYLADDDKPQ